MVDCLLSDVISRLLLLATASELLYALLAAGSRLPPGRSPFASSYHPSRFEETTIFLALFTLLFVVYGLGVAVAGRKQSRSAFVVVLLASALFRGTLLWQSELDESAPSAFLLSPSPLESAGAFLTGHLGPVPIRGAVLSLADVGTVALLAGRLRGASLPSALALVYGWNPLVVKEVAGSARLEAIPIFLIVLAFRLAQGEKRSLAALAYGLSLTGPILPLFPTAPLVGRALGVRVALSLAIASAAWGALATSFPWSWPPSHWTGGSLMPALATLLSLFVTRNPVVPLAVGGSILVLLSGARAWSLKDSRSLPKEALLVAGTSLALAPQVLPSSFLLVAALAAFSGNRGWLLLTATAPLTYFSWGEREWSFWMGFAQYFPAYAGLIFRWLGGKRRTRDGTSSRRRPTSRR